jgi:aminoglycoside phosphotransferase (APT) family kinase protein
MTGEVSLTDVRAAHRFDPAPLERYLSGRLEGFEAPLTIRQFEGGQSNPTYLLEARGRRWVLRKKPPGDLLPSAHQVGREHQVLRALEGSGVPVPRSLLHYPDADLIGSEFFIMEWVPGRVFLDPLLPGLTPDERRSIYDHFIDVLAQLHALDPAAIGLSEGFGRPGNYYARQVSRWTKQYQASRTHDIPEMDRLMAWLADHVPGEERVGVVHGDYTLRNCLIDPLRPRISAVLDWELSTLGHPFADLAHACLFTFSGRSDADFQALGVPTRSELIERYLRASGRSPVSDWRFYFAFALFRIAAINQGVYRRGLEGNAASDHFMEALPGVRASAVRAWELVESGPGSGLGA